MTDDAELRARIEAQVAARRAGASPAKGDRGTDPEADRSASAEGEQPSAAPPKGPAGLAPTRPWTRSRTPPPPPAESPALPRPDGPLRPWQRRGATPPPPEPEPEAPHSATGLTPARPWRGGAGEPAAEPAPTTPAPSNPEIVLQGLAAGVEPETEEQTRRWGRSHPVGGQSLGRRRRSGSDEPESVEPEVAAVVAPPAAYVPDAATVTAFVEAAGPVLEAAEAAAAEAAVDEQDHGEGRRRSGRRRRRQAPDEPTVEPTVVVDEPPARVDQTAPRAVPTALPVTEASAAEPTYPWQQQDEPDRDLHGARTWNPTDYPEEPSAADDGKGRRALRWLLARAPEPDEEVRPAEGTSSAPSVEAADDRVPDGRISLADPEPAPVRAVEPEPEPDPEPEPEPSPQPEPPHIEPPPGTDLPRRLAAAAAAETAVDGAEPPLPFAPKRPLLARLLGRRAEEDEDDDEPYESFTLPEPDESFEKPWLNPSAPSTTRTWRRPPAVDEAGDVDEAVRADEGAVPQPVEQTVPQPTPEPIPQPTPEPIPEPTPEPIPQPTPEPIPQPTPEPPAPTPSPEPPLAVEPQQPPAASARRRPSPGRPAPRPVVAAASAPPVPAPADPPPVESAAVEPAPPEPAVRALGIAGSADTPATAEKPAAHRATEGISGASSDGWGTGTSRRPDIARFLETPDPEPAADEPVEAEPERRGPRVSDKARRFLVRTFVILLIAAIATWLLRAFVVQPYYIPSASMEPTLHGCTGCNDDHVLVDKISYRAHDVRAGDIVVFHRPADATDIPEKVLIKRVVALSGDLVEVKKGHVYVNGLVLDEPYLNKACGANPTTPLNGTSRWKVPANDVFVMGDNRCHSEDSRMFGPIAKSSIIGRAFAIIWPLGRIRLL